MLCISLNIDDTDIGFVELTYLCPSHRPLPTLRHRTLFSAALVIPDQLFPAVSALLQCLASNCCEAGLSFSSPAGSRLRPFLIGNEHERSHEHSKHRCFLIDLTSTSWCLDFARTVFTAVFGSESRHPKRSRI